jgi:hypothetical protein
MKTWVCKECYGESKEPCILSMPDCEEPDQCVQKYYPSEDSASKWVEEIAKESEAQNTAHRTQSAQIFDDICPDCRGNDQHHYCSKCGLNY